MRRWSALLDWSTISRHGLWAHALCARGPHPLWRTVGPHNHRRETARRAQPHPGHTPTQRPGNAHNPRQEPAFHALRPPGHVPSQSPGNARNLQRETARRSPSDIKQSQPPIVSAWGPARHDTTTGRCAAHAIGFRQMIGPPVPDRMVVREDVSTAVATATWRPGSQTEIHTPGLPSSERVGSTLPSTDASGPIVVDLISVVDAPSGAVDVAGLERMIHCYTGLASAPLRTIAWSAGHRPGLVSPSAVLCSD